MKLVIFGAGGHVGQAIVAQAIQRGHGITAVVRHPGRAATLPGAGVSLVAGDIGNTDSYAEVLHGADAVIASISARRDGNPQVIPSHAAKLLDAAALAEVPRLAWVGGAGSLETAPGVRVLDDPGFPADWKAEAQSQAEALKVFRASRADTDWVYISPAALLVDGDSTGQYRIGGDQLLIGADGQSRITVPDYAIALLDRVEKNDRPRQRITVAY